MYPINHFITNNETKKARTDPENIIIHSIPVKENPIFNNFKRVAPNIVGIAKKKVNSAITLFSSPIRSPPRIVEPDLDVPGIIAKH